MVKYNLLQPAIVGAAVLGLVAPAFGVPAQAEETPISITPTLPSLLELNARSTLSKRDSFTKLGRMAATETIKVLLSTNTQTKTAVRKLKSRSQWRYALHRHKSYARALWIWIEIDTAIGEFATFEVPDPDSPEAQKIKLQPGESVKVSNLPNHSGSFRAYARCDEEGPGGAGHEDAAIKWG